MKFLIVILWMLKGEPVGASLVPQLADSVDACQKAAAQLMLDNSETMAKVIADGKEPKIMCFKVAEGDTTKQRHAEL